MANPYFLHIWLSPALTCKENLYNDILFNCLLCKILGNVNKIFNDLLDTTLGKTSRINVGSQ